MGRVRLRPGGAGIGRSVKRAAIAGIGWRHRREFGPIRRGSDACPILIWRAGKPPGGARIGGGVNRAGAIHLAIVGRGSQFGSICRRSDGRPIISGGASHEPGEACID